MSKEKREIIQNILFSLEKLIKTTEKNQDDTQLSSISENISKNRALAFDQMCFYEKYIYPTNSNTGNMQTTYLKWKVIYDSYNSPQKVMRQLHNGLLTKRQQNALLQHFLGKNYNREIQQEGFSDKLPYLIHQKYSNTK